MDAKNTHSESMKIASSLPWFQCEVTGRAWLPGAFIFQGERPLFSGQELNHYDDKLTMVNWVGVWRSTTCVM